MKTVLAKTVLTLSLTALTSYLDRLFLPVIILVCFMLADYISGMVKAWVKSTLSSRVGVQGIVKKLCYLLAVCAGAGVDFVLSAVGGEALPFESPAACMVAIWLIINELISILENLNSIGVPLPGFLIRLTDRLLDKSNGEDS